MKRLLSNKAYKKIIITATLFFILILSINSCAQKTVEQMKADKDIESLIKALDSSDEKIRSEAVIVLGDIGDVSTLEVLIKSLNDEDSNVRKNAAIALGKIGNSKAITPLIEALKDKDLNVRKEAIIALGNIGGEKAVEVLLQKLKDENSVTRSNSADALVNIGEPAVNSLIKLLKDEDINLRDSVIYVLKKVGDIALEPFIKNLKDENWDVRIEAAEYLDLLEWKPKDDVQKAYYFIAKKDWDEAANLGEPAVEPLIKAIKYLKYEDYENRRFAAITLTKIGEPAVEPLIQALEDKDEYVRRWASWTLWTLGYVGDERAIPPKITEVSEYDITHTITLVNDGPGFATRILLHVSLIRDIEPYQKVVSMDIRPQHFKTITDEYDNLYAEFEFTRIASGEKRNIEIRYKAAVNALEFDISKCDCSLPEIFVYPELYIESDAEQIVTLVNKLSKDKETACEKVETFYNYVGDNISYTSNPDDIDEGALLTLEDRSGDCTDFTDSLIALCRAAGIPARFIEGVTCCTNGDYIAQENKHNWLEIYMPCVGWVPMDPTWGRFQANRETYFAGITADHIIVGWGRNLDILKGYYYFHYNYWWGVESTTVSNQEEWEIVKVDK